MKFVINLTLVVALCAVSTSGLKLRPHKNHTTTTTTHKPTEETTTLATTTLIPTTSEGTKPVETTTEAKHDNDTKTETKSDLEKPEVKAPETKSDAKIEEKETKSDLSSKKSEEKPKPKRAIMTDPHPASKKRATHHAAPVGGMRMRRSYSQSEALLEELDTYAMQSDDQTYELAPAAEGEEEIFEESYEPVRVAVRNSAPTRVASDSYSSPVRIVTQVRSAPVRQAVRTRDEYSAPVRTVQVKSVKSSPVIQAVRVVQSEDEYSAPAVRTVTRTSHARAYDTPARSSTRSASYSAPVRSSRYRRATSDIASKAPLPPMKPVSQLLKSKIPSTDVKN